MCNVLRRALAELTGALSEDNDCGHGSGMKLSRGCKRTSEYKGQEGPKVQKPVSEEPVYRSLKSPLIGALSVTEPTLQIALIMDQ